MSPLLIVSISVFLEILCLGAILPVLHLYCGELGGSAVWVGVLFALMSGPKVVMNPFWGWLSDRWGRKPVLALVTIGCITGSLAWALSASLIWLTISRLISGIFGAQAVLAFAVAADTSTPEKRAASMGVLGAAFSLGMSIGPLLGGWIGETYGYEHVGTLCVVLEALSLASILFLLPETRPRALVSTHELVLAPNQLRRLATRQEVMVIVVITFIVSLALAEMTSSYGLLNRDWYQFDARDTAYAFALFGLIGAIVQGGLVRLIVSKSSERAATFWGLLILASGFCAVSLHLPVPVFWTATALIAIGSALATPALTGLLSRCVNRDEQGWILGINQGATGLGRTAGAGLAGGLFVLSKGSPFWSAGALTLVCVLLLAWVQGGEVGAPVDAAPDL